MIRLHVVTHTHYDLECDYCGIRMMGGYSVKEQLIKEAKMLGHIILDDGTVTCEKCILSIESNNAKQNIHSDKR
jgi:hypothetical protein